MSTTKAHIHSQPALSSTARGYLLFLGDVSDIKSPSLKLVLKGVPIARHFILSMTAVLVFAGQSELSESVVFTLFNKLHGVIALYGQFYTILIWNNRKNFVQLVEEFSELMTRYQVHLEPKIRAQVTEQCEARHLRITRILSWITVASFFIEALKPLVSYLLNPSPDKLFRLPYGMLDPGSTFLIDMGIHMTLMRGVFYSLFVISALNTFLIIFYTQVSLILLLDKLKTLFYISGLIFRRLRDVEFGINVQWSQAIQFHQRVFRLSSKVRTFLEPILSSAVVFSVLYNSICSLLLTQDLILKNTFAVYGIALTLVLDSIAFVLPTATYHTAEEVSDCAYFNDNWTRKRSQTAYYSQMVIMRASRSFKFRVFNCWILSSRNFIQYVKKSYEFFAVFRIVTSKLNSGQHLLEPH